MKWFMIITLKKKKYFKNLPQKTNVPVIKETFNCENLSTGFYFYFVLWRDLHSSKGTGFFSFYHKIIYMHIHLFYLVLRFAGIAFGHP